MLEAKISRLIKGTAALLLAATLNCAYPSKIIPKDGNQLCFEVERQDTAFSFCTKDVNLKDLDHIADVKAFAQKEFGLYKTSNYVAFKDPPRTLNSLIVTSTMSSPLSPYEYRWQEVEGDYCNTLKPPLKFSSEVDSFEDEKACYEEKGYDVYLKSVTGIGDGSNISYDYLEGSLVDRTDVIFHEDLHQTDQLKGNGDMKRVLQESRAQWVGLTGAIQYFRHQGDQKNQIHAIYRYSNWLSYSQRLNTAVRKLEQLQKEKPCLTGDLVIKREREILDEVSSGTSKAVLIERLNYAKYFPLLDQIYARSGHNHHWMMEEVIFKTPHDEEEALEFFKSKL